MKSKTRDGLFTNASTAWKQENKASFTLTEKDLFKVSPHLIYSHDFIILNCYSFLQSFVAAMNFALAANVFLCTHGAKNCSIKQVIVHKMFIDEGSMV